MLRETREPVLSADNVRGLHQMIVDSVREMIGRDAVGFEKHEILVVLRNLERALYLICELRLLLRVAVG